MHRPIYAGQSSKIASTTTISSYSRPQTSDEGVGKATGSDNHVGRSQSTTDKGEEGDEQSTWETATNLASQAAAQTVESMKMIAVAASHAIARGAISEDEEDKLGSAEHSPEKTEYKPRPVIKTPPHEDAAPAAKVVHPNRSTVKVPQKTTVVVNDKNLHPHTPTTTGPPSWPRQQPVQVTRVTKTTRVAKAPGARIAPRTPHQQQNEKGKDEVEEQSMVGSPMTQRRGHKAPEDWISILIEVLWPKIRKVTEDIAWEQVPPVLDQNRPSWIHGMRMVKFELGKKEPDIRRVECFADEEDAVDDVFIELDLEWKSRQDVEIEIQVLGSDISSLVPNALETQLARLMTMRVGIEDCWLQGRVRVALRPLLWRIPIVGAAQVSFTRMPLFEFKPTVTGGPMGSLLEALLPYVKSWLQQTVQEAIFMPYVLPEHYFYPIEPGVPDIKRPVGIMHCRVIEARKVPKMDMFGSSDTFVEAYVGHGSRKETKIMKGRNPKWDKVFRFPVHVPEFQKVQFVLWDYDTYSTNDEIGKCQVAISDIPENEKKEMWLSVESEEKIQQEKLKDQKNAIGGRKRDRVFQNIVMSGAPPSTKKTELFVRIHWRRWDEQEQDIINEAVRVGAWRMLESKKGASCSRELRKLLLSGTVSITVKKCRGLQVHGILQRPSIKAVVKVADMEPAESPSFKVTRRGNADLSGTPVQVDVEGHTVENDSNDIFIKLQEVGFMSGNDVVGVLRFNLRKLVDQRFISGKFQLQDPNKADIKFSDSMPNSSVEESVANVDVKWVGTFS